MASWLAQVEDTTPAAEPGHPHDDFVVTSVEHADPFGPLPEIPDDLPPPF